MSDFELLQAPLTNTLIVLNIVIGGYAFYVNQAIIDRFSLRTGSILEDRQYYRLFSSGFLHANPLHILFNMIALFFFGPAIESELGSTGFGIMYLGSMLIAHVIAVYIKRFSPDYSVIGASGAITGVVFSYCLFWPLQPIYFLLIPVSIPAFVFAILYTAYSIYAMGSSNSGGRIAHEAHIGGALGGIFLTICLDPILIENLMRQVS